MFIIAYYNPDGSEPIDMCKLISAASKNIWIWNVDNLNCLILVVI